MRNGGSPTAQAFWENDYRQSLYLDSDRPVGRTRGMTLAKIAKGRRGGEKINHRGHRGHREGGEIEHGWTG